MVRIQKSVAKKPEHLELGVIPQGNFLQKFSKLFRNERCNLRLTSAAIENNIRQFQHRLELIRTIATCTNVLISTLVLLKVFKVI